MTQPPPPPNSNDEGDDHEIWKSPPPPPMPDFPKIPQALKDAADGKPKEKSSLAGFGAGWALALDFVGTVLASWLIGFGIDWWQKTGPWGTLIGLGFGFGYGIYRMLKQSQREERRQSRK